MDAMLVFAVLDVVWNFINDCSVNPVKRAEFITDEISFTRNRVLSFKNVVGIILNNRKSDLASNLENYLYWDNPESEDWRDPANVVSKSAFSQQREKIKSSFFVKLLEVFRDAFYTQYKPKVKKWKEWILCALDGSRASLPDTRDMLGRYGSHKHAKGDQKRPLALLTFAYDVLNNFILTARMVNKKIGEVKMAVQDIKDLGEGYLFLMDRGYCSFLLFYLLMKRGNKFVCRGKMRLLKSVKDFIEKGQTDGYIEMKAYHKAVKQLKAEEYQVKCGETIKVRAVKIILPNGETEVLLTNLTPEEASISELSDLYNLRWGVEVAIGIMKNEQQIEIFTGIRENCVEQDFYATVFLYNFEMMVEKLEEENLQKTNAAHKKKGMLPLAIDHNECWNTIKKIFRSWICAKDSQKANARIRSILPLLEDHRYTVRKGRSFPRTFRIIKLLGKYITLNNYRAVV